MVNLLKSTNAYFLFLYNCFNLSPTCFATVLESRCAVSIPLINSGPINSPMHDESVHVTRVVSFAGAFCCVLFFGCSFLLFDKQLVKITTETISKPNLDTSHPLYGKTVVLTGTRDKDVIEYLKNVGANLGSSISKNTFLVVTKSTDDDTGKAEEARKLNIPLISVQDFMKTYL